MSKKYACKTVLDLLISIPPQDLKQVLNSEVQSHLSKCVKCREVYNSLVFSQSEFEKESPRLPKPDPGIRSNILRHMNQSHHQEQKASLPAENNLLKWLFKPIPAYQAIIAVMLVVLLFNITSREDTKPDAHLEPVGNPTPVMIRADIYSINDLNLMNQQKIGINATEDSVLSSLLYITM